MTAASGNPLFDYRMPQWYVRLAYLWRGLCFGFMAGFLSALWMGRTEMFPIWTAVSIVLACCFLAVLPSIPKAWIEHRNRVRALQDGTSEEELAAYRHSADTDR